MLPDPQSPGAGDPARSTPDPNLVLILNLLLFGSAGYWLIGQRAKAVIAAILWCIGWMSCGVVSGAVMAVAAADGYMQARKLANRANGAPSNEA